MAEIRLVKAEPQNRKYDFLLDELKRIKKAMGDNNDVTKRLKALESSTNKMLEMMKKHPMKESGMDHEAMMKMMKTMAKSMPPIVIKMDKGNQVVPYTS